MHDHGIRMTRRRHLQAAATLLAVTLTAAAQADEFPPPATPLDCNGREIGKEHPDPAQRTTWSGSCLDGMAEGVGVLEGFIDDKLEFRLAGRLHAGLPEGAVVVDLEAIHLHYEGPIVDRFPEGNGKLTQRDGTVITALFKRGGFEGDVDAVIPDGTRYHGQWSNQHPEGKGSALLPDGSRYTGSFHQGAPHGEGVLEVSGVTVRGVWQDGKMEGLVESFGQDGTHGTSTYRAGVLDGPYRYEQPGIVVVRGQYSAGLREGRWESAEANGRVSHKVFVHDEMVAPEETTPAPAASPD